MDDKQKAGDKRRVVPQNVKSDDDEVEVVSPRKKAKQPETAAAAPAASAAAAAPSATATSAAAATTPVAESDAKSLAEWSAAAQPPNMRTTKYAHYVTTAQETLARERAAVYAEKIGFVCPITLKPLIESGPNYAVLASDGNFYSVSGWNKFAKSYNGNGLASTKGIGPSGVALTTAAVAKVHVSFGLEKLKRICDSAVPNYDPRSAFEIRCDHCGLKFELEEGDTPVCVMRKLPMMNLSTSDAVASAIVGHANCVGIAISKTWSNHQRCIWFDVDVPGQCEIWNISCESLSITHVVVKLRVFGSSDRKNSTELVLPDRPTVSSFDASKLAKKDHPPNWRCLTNPIDSRAHHHDEVYEKCSLTGWHCRGMIRNCLFTNCLFDSWPKWCHTQFVSCRFVNCVFQGRDNTKFENVPAMLPSINCEFKDVHIRGDFDQALAFARKLVGAHTRLGIQCEGMSLIHVSVAPAVPIPVVVTQVAAKKPEANAALSA